MKIIYFRSIARNFGDTMSTMDEIMADDMVDAIIVSAKDVNINPKNRSDNHQAVE